MGELRREPEVCSDVYGISRFRLLQCTKVALHPPKRNSPAERISPAKTLPNMGETLILEPLRSAIIRRAADRSAHAVPRKPPPPIGHMGLGRVLLYPLFSIAQWGFRCASGPERDFCSQPAQRRFHSDRNSSADRSSQVENLPYAVEHLLKLLRST